MAESEFDQDFWDGVYRRAEAIGNLPLAEVMKDEYALHPDDLRQVREEMGREMET